MSLPTPRSDIAQKPFQMSPHKGLLHDIVHATETAQGHIATIASNPTITQNVTETANTTGSHGGGSHHKAEGHMVVYYISRAFPLICLGVVLLLALCRGVVAIRHWRRIRRRTLRTNSGHSPLSTVDPDEVVSTSNVSTPASSLRSTRSRSTGASADGTYDGSESTLVEPLIKPGRIDADIDHLEIGEGGRARGSRGGRISRYWSAWEAVYRNWMYLRTVPSWLYGPDTMADAMWTLGYSAMMIAFALASIPVESEFWALYFANALGVLAFCQCPLIIILIQKNNPISFLTGITYQKLNYLHRASSRVALFFSYAHIALWTPRVWHAGHFTHWYIIWGIIAILGFTGLWVTSFRFIRRVAFEFFLVAHILFTIVFIGGAILHWYRLQFWLWPCFAIWGLDRLVRGIRMLYINPPAGLRWFKSASAPEDAGQCEMKLLSKDVMLLTARRPGLQWTAGQHFFLSCPSVSGMPQETHPFSVANMPNERDEVVFLVRVHSGFTKKLRDRLHEEITTNIPIYLEGPYGSSHSISSYSTVILIAGGTGITFLSANLLGLLQPSTPLIPRHIHLVWHIRHSDDVKWLSPLLNEATALSRAYPTTRLTFDIHVTKSGRADEPAPTVGFTDRLVEDYAPRRFSRRFSRHQGGYKVLESGGVSELPSAVASDDEDEGDVVEQGDHLDPVDSVPVSRARTVRTEDEEIRDEEDEIDELERGDTAEPLPSTRTLGTNARGNTMVVDSTGLSPEAAALVFWKKGRADLREVLQGDLDTTTGPINVTVCGPVQLMHAARRAVKDVATPERAIRGDWPVDFYEETLGS